MPILSCRPIASSPAKRRRASDWLITAIGCEPLTSASTNPRPCTIGISIVAKNNVSTERRHVWCVSMKDEASSLPRSGSGSSGRAETLMDAELLISM